ncbi:MAG TPA: GNAT family N-acetyltransferase [Baekduia sp.]|nr:GNAT family N-acetyltransferase [Baekduia sp.]
MEVRLAQRSDIDQLAAVLARAFEDDPIYEWSFGQGAKKWSRRFFKWQLKRLLPQDVTWTVDGCGGAAVWALPRQWRESTTDLLRLVLITTPAIRHRMRAVVAGLTLVDERHPVKPHMYLALLGVDPAEQGKGVGSALLAPGLEICDREQLPAYLETGKEKNLAFYGRHGFAETGRVDIPDGPSVWTMWREPR